MIDAMATAGASTSMTVAVQLLGRADPRSLLTPVPSSGRGRLRRPRRLDPTGGGLRPESSGPAALDVSLIPPTRRVPRWTMGRQEWGARMWTEHEAAPARLLRSSPTSSPPRYSTIWLIGPQPTRSQTFGGCGVRRVHRAPTRSSSGSSGRLSAARSRGEYIGRIG